MNVFCVGLSHHQTKVETLEYFAGGADAPSRLRGAGCVEALLLSTCNRVEVYGAAGTAVGTADIARCLTGAVANIPLESSAAFYRMEGEACLTHLFRVASGLDSMVIGETEILGQVKRAYEIARSTGSAGSFLHRLFQRAFRVAKQVRTHTDITRGLVSVGSVAVDLAGKIFGDLGQRKVLVLGAGETSERTARALVSRGVSDLLVSNRSIERAHELAKAVGGQVVPFENWTEQCGQVDILISSTSSGTPLLHAENLHPILRERIDRPLFIIDIAVPRDIHPDVNQLEGVFLYDIDSLQSVAEQSLALRRQQIASAETIIAEHVGDFWKRFLRDGNAGDSLITPGSSLSSRALRASES